MADEEKPGNKMFIFRTKPEMRDEVAKFAAKRVIEGKTGDFTASTYSSNQVFIEAVRHELKVEDTTPRTPEAKRLIIGISINFPTSVHQALSKHAKDKGKSMNEALNEIINKYMQGDVVTNPTTVSKKKQKFNF